MIYLVSRSPRRKKILKDLKICFKTLHPEYHEKAMPGATPAKLVRTHALGKALSALHFISEGKILSADTVVYFKGRIIGKPKNKKDAVKILGTLQGKWHQVYTGVVVLKIKNKEIVERLVFVEKTIVRLHPMGRLAILNYFKRVNPMDKAGAYAIQAARSPIVAEVRGSFFNAVGLPVETLKKALVL